MIIVRIDTDLLQSHQHNIMHSIHMMQVLRAAGMPVIGKIIFNGPERGTFVQWREQDLDGDEWVVQWWDEYENGRAGANSRTSPRGWLVTGTGRGHGFTWTTYRHPDDPAPVVSDDW
jgi:hypothetical protein